MKSNKKNRKTYQKPEIVQVRLELEEAVLLSCKASPGDSAGKSAKWCGHASCKKTYGS